MCVDYRVLNKATVKNKYPVPLVQDLMDRLSKASWFTKLDLRAGYWQVRIAEGDEPKTTCVTRYGSYEFLVMLFGLTNAPATFCNLMNNVLFDYLDDFVVVYLDDTVICSRTLDEHVNHLSMVLSHVKDLRSFLGLTNYYRKFIAGYSKRAATLTDLLKKDVKWVWSVRCQEAFQNLKEAIASEPILKLPDFELPFEVWRVYLLGTRFVVRTDNVANTFFKTQKKLSPKQARWQEFLIEDDLLHFKGGRIVVPNGGGLRKDLMKEAHDTTWAGHPGVERMLALLSRFYFWPKMEDDTEAYVKTFHVCQMDKTERKKEAGLLQPLPIPERPWLSVSMDFISGFPKVDDKASIMVVVDRFLKYSVFIAAPNLCSSEISTELFYKYVVKYFGVPADIVSDRGTRFTGRFWTAMFNMMGTELKFSTANHPQTDGQTERINHLLEEYLRHYVTTSQRNWVALLDTAQFCNNLHKSSATEMSPFEIVLGK
ncbi:hypothetical protein MTR67_018833 [Solanum verrucosum]|uniref:Integrase catalytic domain-containing protein n=1 Tax=Solanum verrucosum TaxID=315347 RepID=A0AAF0TU48_SOLVR|nr:hypothetical protein MTR67_018833 [Solanum verrucosum]